MPSCANAVGSRHAHIVEGQNGRVAAVMAQFVQLAADAEAGQVGIHDKERHAAKALFVAGAGQQAEEVGLRTVGDPHFGAVDEVVVAVAPRPGFDGGHVGTGAWFADGDGRHHIPGDGRDEVAAVSTLQSRFQPGWG